MPAFGISTYGKLRIARRCFQILTALGFKPERIVTRRGIRYELDIREGIDFAIFVLGGFQGHVSALARESLADGGVAIDVGANVGAIALSVASSHPGVKVFAFEPTDYAFKKLQRNIELNSRSLGGRVIPVQAFLSDTDADCMNRATFSSWPIDKLDGERHAVHGGVLKAATHQQWKLDTFVETEGLSRVDFIKIDTDGYELEVLAGAVRTIERFKPRIVFELTNYLLSERGQSFSDFENYFYPKGYSLCDAQSRCRLRSDSIDELIVSGGSIDVVAFYGEVMPA